MNGIRWLVLALLLSGCAAYQAHEARKNNEAVIAQMKADLAMCASNPLLTTHVQRAYCMNAVVTDSYSRLIPPHPLVAVRINALRLRLAEQEDAEQITAGQAAEQMAALGAEIQAEEQQANQSAAVLQEMRSEALLKASTSLLNNASTNLAAPSYRPLPTVGMSPTMP